MEWEEIKKRYGAIHRNVVTIRSGRLTIPKYVEDQMDLGRYSFVRVYFNEKDKKIKIVFKEKKEKDQSLFTLSKSPCGIGILRPIKELKIKEGLYPIIELDKEHGEIVFSYNLKDREE